MARTRTPPSPLSRPGTVFGLLLLTATTAWPAALGFPTNGRELDSAVDGVQKYLESSGFPKMTRGEVLDFLSDFSRGVRVGRSDGGKKDDAVTSKDIGAVPPADAPKIPPGESPLNYGYPMSAVTAATATGRSAASAATGRPAAAAAAESSPASRDRRRGEDARDETRPTGVLGGAKKMAAGPPADVNAYAKFKKIPEAKNLKMDDDMRAFLGGFGLLDDGPAKKKAEKTEEKPSLQAEKTAGKPLRGAEAQRRADGEAAATETVDAALLKSVLIDTAAATANDNRTAAVADLSHALLEESASSARGHVFKPSDPDVRTVDVNRIAKIVENIRLLADDNATVSLSQEAIQKKLENITAAIAAIDSQPATASQDAASKDKPFDGYDVFFDDDSKDVDSSDLPESPTGGIGGGGSGGGGGEVVTDARPADQLPLNEAHNPPDPLSTDELQHLLEKNKNDVKRQEPAVATTTTADAAEVTTTAAAASTSTADSSSEATSTVEVTSDPSAAARDSSTAAAADVSPSLSQLAESFGGGETASSPPPAAVDGPVSPDRPRSGLYFYVDWNSFLTVNEGQKNQVNLRFAPKAGNPAHFIKVNVP